MDNTLPVSQSGIAALLMQIRHRLLPHRHLETVMVSVTPSIHDWPAKAAESAPQAPGRAVTTNGGKDGAQVAYLLPWLSPLCDDLPTDRTN